MSSTCPRSSVPLSTNTKAGKESESVGALRWRTPLCARWKVKNGLWKQLVQRAAVTTVRGRKSYQGLGLGSCKGRPGSQSVVSEARHEQARQHGQFAAKSVTGFLPDLDGLTVYNCENMRLFATDCNSLRKSCFRRKSLVLIAFLQIC